MTFLCDLTAARAALPTGAGPTPPAPQEIASVPISNAQKRCCLLQTCPQSSGAGWEMNADAPPGPRLNCFHLGAPPAHPAYLQTHVSGGRPDGLPAAVLLSAGRALVGLGLPLLAAAIVTLGESGTQVQAPSQKHL